MTDLLDQPSVDDRAAPATGAAAHGAGVRDRWPPLELTYLVPLRTAHGDDLGDLPGHLAAIARLAVDVLVVDGSDPAEVERHRRALDGRVRLLTPDETTPMGKVGGVLTGLQHARCDKVVIADDDVRYDADQLRTVERLLDDAEVVRPQNCFEPARWHTHVDTARILLNRAVGGDWPGTLGVRRHAVLDAGGYAGDVLFENLELVRTVRAAGGRQVVALDVVVPRRPPTTAHFRGQQVRQAYDELARPWRLAASLAVAPLVATAAWRHRWRALVAGAALSALVAEAGRRRAGGRHAFPARASVLAPGWLLWRSLCSYVAVGARLRGGVRYRDVRLRHAATPPWRLRRAVSGRVGGAGRPGGDLSRAPGPGARGGGRR